MCQEYISTSKAAIKGMATKLSSKTMEEYREIASKDEVVESSNSFGDQQTNEDEAALDKIIAEADEVQMQHSVKVAGNIVKNAITAIPTE